MSNYAEVIVIVDSDNEFVIDLLESGLNTIIDRGSIKFTKMSTSGDETGKKFSSIIYVATGHVTSNQINNVFESLPISCPESVQILISDENDPNWDGLFMDVWR